MSLERILVISKQRDMQQILQDCAQQLFAADDIKDAAELLSSAEPDMIVIGSDIRTDCVCDFLENTKQTNRKMPPIIIISADAQNNHRQFIQLGAYDCLCQSNAQKRIKEIITEMNGNTANTRIVTGANGEQSCTPSIVGQSRATQKTLQMIKLVAKSACNPVLIVGETGTGKELAAQAVHEIRHGSSSKFVAVNCAALNSNLLESELFGHVKGSFTSADREKTGLLELAGDGSIYLDEISEMPLDLQAKLLRVLQDKTFRKVGGLNEIPCRATIITSSNKNLLAEAKAGKFRQDLYYRLSICPIVLTPLRAEPRKDDIVPLAEYFIQNSDICPGKKGKIKGLTKMASQALLQHSWPGNVRELRNVIERAILLETSDRIGTSNLYICTDDVSDMMYEEVSPAVRDFSLDKAEKELVARALAEAGWQKTRAAALLGITRATLYAKVKQYKIQTPESIPAAMNI